jgi:hypothetical protein
MFTLVSLITVAFGMFATISPARASRFWGWKNIEQLGPTARTWYFRVYRTSGVLLCLAGILLAASEMK